MNTYINPALQRLLDPVPSRWDVAKILIQSYTKVSTVLTALAGLPDAI